MRRQYANEIRDYCDLRQYFILFICLFLFLPAISHAEPELVLTDTQGKYFLGKYVKVFEDTSAKLTINDVTRPEYSDRFKTFNEDKFSFGFSRSAFWVSLKIKNETRLNNWLLDQQYANTHYLDLYLPNEDGKTYKVIHSGNLQPYSNRDVSHRRIIFNLPLDPGKEIKVYLRLQTQAASTVNLRLWSESGFVNNDRIESFLMGMYYGLIGLLFSINLFLYLFFRKSSYLYLTLFIFSIGTALLFYDGYAQIFFKPDYVASSQHFLPMLLSTSLVTLLLFGRGLFSAFLHNTFSNRIQYILIVTWVILFFIKPFTDYVTVMSIAAPFFLFSLLFLFANALIGWHRQNGPARFVVIGLLSFFLGFLGIILTGYGFVESNFILEEGIRTGIFTLILFMSFAIIDHIQQLQAAKEQTSKAFVESEDKFKLISEQSMLGMVIIQDNVFKYVNNAISQKAGYDIKAMMEWKPGEWLARIIHPDYLPMVIDQANKKQQGESGAVQNYTCRALNKSGKTFWVEIFSRTVQYNSRPADLVTIVDISERKRIEQAINNIAIGVSGKTDDAIFRNITENLCHLFNAKYAFIGLLDETDPSMINTVAFSIDGRPAENTSYQLKDTPCAVVISDGISIYPDEVQQRFPKDLFLRDMNVEGYIGIPLISTNKNRSGLIVVMDTKPLANLDQVQSILVIFATRASAELDRLKAESALRESEMRFRQLAENINAVFWLGSLDWNEIYYISPAYEKNWGQSAKALCENPRIWIEAVHPDDRAQVVADIPAGINAIGDHIEFRPYRLQKPDGEFRWIKAHAYPIRDAAGKNIRIAGIAEDITEQVSMEESLRRSQKMDALGKLTGGIAHDYNNMLGIVMGYAELLKEEVREQPKLANYVQEIYRASERGAKLTRKLLSFSRHKASNDTVVDLNELLQDEQNMLEKTLTARINLVLDLSSDLWPVRLDSGELEDAVLNMSINAMHAIEGHGQLTIKTSNKKITISQALQLQLEAGDYVLVDIIDTGCGMEKVVEEKIFDPFYSTKGELGTGLGLSQVYGFINRSGGGISVDSTPGKGTRFTFYFPRYMEIKSKNQQIQNYNQIDAKGSESILLVDDEVAILNLNEEILSKHGYKIFCAENGKKALEILEQESIDLLISDVIMPEMDGFELAAIVNEKYPAIKIQLASGFSHDSDKKIINSTLHKNMLQKPFISAKLLERVKSLLDK